MKLLLLNVHESLQAVLLEGGPCSVFVSTINYDGKPVKSKLCNLRPSGAQDLQVRLTALFLLFL